MSVLYDGESHDGFRVVVSADVVGAFTVRISSVEYPHDSDMRAELVVSREIAAEVAVGLVHALAAVARGDAEPEREHEL